MHQLLQKSGEASRLLKKHQSQSWPIMSPAGPLRLCEVLGQSIWPSLIFLVVFLLQIQKFRFEHGLMTNIVTTIAIVLMMSWPTLSLFVYMGGIFKTVRSSVARSSAVVFWLYWPFWRFVMCLVAACVAYSLGNNLWQDNFKLYEEYYRLQAYDNVDSHSVTGTRLQDAGLVRFNVSDGHGDGVDRSKAGCIINGHTYCIAPIVRGGVVTPGKAQSKTGVLDLFVAGIDCCNCPVTDFRCGQWDDSSGKLGGMRLLDEEHNRMFRLAAEKFGADYGKVSARSVFFEWVNEPIAAWKNLWTRGMQLAFLFCIFAVFASFLINVVLNGFVHLLRDLKIAAPLDDAPPSMPGLSMGGKSQMNFIPDEYRHYLAQQDPIGEENPKFLIL